MDADKVALRVRGYAGDFAKVKYSDFQVVDALNCALRLLAETSAQGGKTLFRKSDECSVVAGVFSLPDDFVSPVRAYGADGAELLILSESSPADEGEVLIHGDKGYTGEAAVSLVYNALPEEVEALTEEIDLSAAWELPLSRAAAMFLVGDASGAAKMLAAFFGGGNGGDSQ